VQQAASPRPTPFPPELAAASPPAAAPQRARLPARAGPLPPLLPDDDDDDLRVDLGRSPSAASSLASEPIRAVRFGRPGDEEQLLAAQRAEEAEALAAADAALAAAPCGMGGACAAPPPAKCGGGLHLGCLPADLVRAAGAGAACLACPLPAAGRTC
jgi:hypothetical protein